MKVIGIDPGTATTGWAILAEQGKSQILNSQLIACGSIKTHASDDLAYRLRKIYEQIQKIIEKYQPQAMAVEELFFAQNVKTAIAVGHARGVAMLAAAKMKIPVYEYTPLQVKQAVVGYGRAEKKQIQAMLKVLLKTKNIPKQDDTADAIAVAICHANSSRMDQSLIVPKISRKARVAC